MNVTKSINNCLVNISAINVVLKREKSLNSTAWLERRINDKYIELAKTENYRCRSAFKLLEIDKKYNVLRPGLNVIDLGAAPGSWTQILVKKINSDGKDLKKPKGFVISVDRLPFFPVEGATTLSKLDFTLETSRARILNVLGDRRVDLIVSDMAPNATGVRQLDQDGILNLAKEALRFAILTSSPNASCLIKLWDGGSRQELEAEILRFYHKLNHIRPQSTQTESSELFLLGRGFKGLKTDPT